MKKLFLLGFLFMNWTFVLSKSTECTCSNMDEINIKQLVDADLVFRGKVITQHTLEFPEIGYQYVSTFQVTELIRGEVEEKSIEIMIGYGKVCDPKFFPNTEYLVLAKYNSKAEKYETSVCIGFRIWDESSTWNRASVREKRMIHEFQGIKYPMVWRNSSHQVYAKGKVLNGVPIGYWEFKNRIQTTESGNFLNGKKEGDWLVFTRNSWVCDWMGLPITCNLETFEPSQPEGWVFSRTPYKNGMIHGSLIIYHESGCIERESFYENGIQIEQIIIY